MNSKLPTLEITQQPPIPNQHINDSLRTYYCTSSFTPTYLPPLYQLPFLATWKINPQLHPLSNHSKNMRNKGFNDLSPHVETKDLPPKPFLQHLRYIKKGRKYTTVHLYTTYPSKTSSFPYYPLQKEKKPKKVFRSFLMDFQSPNPYPTLTSPKHYPPSSSPYLPLISHVQKAPLAMAYRQLHLHKNILFNREMLSL